MRHMWYTTDTDTKYERKQFFMKKILSLTLSVLLLLSALACLASCEKTLVTDGNSVFVVTQVGNEQKFSVTWNSSKKVTGLEIKVTHGKQTVAQAAFSGEELGDSVTVDAYYGKHDVELKAIHDDGSSSVINCKVALSADEYVIAPISGSMPQLYFTLNIKEITDEGNIPTFVWLTRPESWNWDALPENVFAMPTVELEEILVNNNYDRMVSVVNDYIKELYEINPDSKFNLYINDYNIYLYLKLLTANGIPEDNYYVTLLSDGGASYSAFNEAFNVEEEGFDADAKYADMASKLNSLYEEVRTAGDYPSGGTFSVDSEELRQYAYVAAKEMDNVEWWILRPRSGVLCSPDEEFITMVLNDDKTEGIIEERNFASPLTAMTDEEKDSLLNLYNFNGEMFAQAEKENKKAMMILGSWAFAENEPNFNDYVNLVKAYYGEEEFVYYYKGHPNTPTSLYPDKQAQLEELCLIDVESSINAELILFFYPDIYMCGYNSSTFLSVQSPEMACAMFNMTPEAAAENESMTEYKDLIGIYLSLIGEDSEYADLCEGDGTYILIQPGTDTEVEWDIGIFDSAANTITYYNAVDGGYTAVE